MVTVLESLNRALHHAFASDPSVYLLGEDILDPYGGAFKVTRGLSSFHPERVLTTPVSEAGFTGIAAGMALRGLRPVVELMFGDFLTLATDQLVNHIAKFRWMYNDQVRLPMVIRTPMGGRRGYGPTHSQTLEKHFLGLPGIRVLAPTHIGDPGQLLEDAILKTEDPVLFIENKLLYLLQVQDEQSLREFDVDLDLGSSISITGSGFSPTYTLKIRGVPNCHMTLATYGYMSELALQAAHTLAYQFEIFVELVVFTQLAPLQIEPLLESLSVTNKLLTIEEGSLSFGWGAELIARSVQELGAKLHNVQRIAALDSPVPASGPLESSVLPSLEQIIQQSRLMV